MPQQQSQSQMTLTGPGWMILSAAMFGYFGFLYGINWNTPGIDGQIVLFRIMLGWTLKVSAIVFAFAALITFVNKYVSNLIYIAVGLISSVLFIFIIIMDLLDSQHGIFGGAPVILGIFAVWNGFGSYSSLREILKARRVSGYFNPESH